MTDKGKEKLIIATISIVLTAALSIPTTLIAAKVNKPGVTQNIIQLPDGQTVNADEIAALQSENVALKSENASLVAQVNALPQETSPPTTTGPTTTKAPAMQYLLDVVPPTDSDNTFFYSVSGGKRINQKGETFEMSGKTYSNGITWSSTGAMSLHSLDGNYSRISGILGHVDGSGNAGGTLQIYYDEVLKKEISLKYDMLDDPLILDDLDDVRRLKFVLLREEYGYGPRYGFANITIE